MMPSVASVVELSRQGALAAWMLPVLAGLIVTGTAALAGLTKARNEMGAALAIDPWSPLMGVSLYFMAVSALQIFVPSDIQFGAQGFYSAVAAGSWAYMVGLPLAVAAVAMLRAVQFNATAVAPQPLARAMPGIAVVVGICLASALASRLTDGLILGTQNLVPVVVAVLAAMAALTDPTPVTAE